MLLNIATLVGYILYSIVGYDALRMRFCQHREYQNQQTRLRGFDSRLEGKTLQQLEVLATDIQKLKEDIKTTSKKHRDSFENAPVAYFLKFNFLRNPTSADNFETAMNSNVPDSNANVTNTNSW